MGTRASRYSTGPEQSPPPELEPFARALAERLGVPVPDLDLVLGLAGQAAHGVVRPAAPVAAYLVGYATGSTGTTPEQAADTARAVIRELQDRRVG